MKNSKDNRITDPSMLDYRAKDFYDSCAESDLFEYSPLFKELSETPTRYGDKKLIASGGMKDIYKVFDNYTGRYIAYAQLQKEIPEEFYEPFIREARLTAGLEHPNIIKVHEIAVSNNRPYFTMDLKTGDTLGDIISKLCEEDKNYQEKYKLRALLVIFLKVCDAISYAHSRNVIHLDVKPENIQVGDFGEVLVCDWGLGKILGEEENVEEILLNPDLLNNVTVNGEIKGTPGYMAPEQINIDDRKDTSTDIYALGALLYTILTLKRPLEGSLDDIMKNTLDGNIQNPLQRAPELMVPESLSAVALKALTTNKEGRYANVIELKNEITKYLSGYSTVAEKAGLIKEFKLFVSRNKQACFIAASFTIILIISVIAFINSLKESRNNEVLARKEAEKNMHIAQKERAKAEDNLRKYQSEKEMMDISLSRNPGGVIYELSKNFEENFLKDPVTVTDEFIVDLERITQSNSSSKILFDLVAQIYFIRQQFDLSYKALLKGQGREHHLNKYLFSALESIKDFKSDGPIAPPQITVKAIQNLLGEHKTIMVKMCIYDGLVRNSKKDHALVVKSVLKGLNPDWQMEKFEYSVEKKSLALAGECNNLRLWFNIPKRSAGILDGLNLQSLDLSEVKNVSLHQLDTVQLNILNLSQIRINSLNGFNKNTAKTVVVTEKLVKPDLMKKLQSMYNVEFAE